MNSLYLNYILKFYRENGFVILIYPAVRIPERKIDA